MQPRWPWDWGPLTTPLVGRCCDIDLSNRNPWFSFVGSQSSVHCTETLDLVNAKVQQRDFAVPCYRFFPYVAHSDAIQHTRPILDTLLKSISFIAGRSSHLWQKIKILSHPSSSFLQYMQFYRWLVVSKFQLGSNLTYLGGTKYIPSTSQNGKICRRWGPPSFKFAYNPHELWLYLPINNS